MENLPDQLASSSISAAMAHHNHHSPPSPMVASSNQTLFLYLSISLPSLDQTPKVSTSLYTRFSPNPNPCSRYPSHLGLKSALWGVWVFGDLVSDGELLFFLCFCWWVWIGYAGNGDERVEDLRETHRASVEVERVVEAQSGWENRALGRERETQLRWEREFYWIQIG